MIKDKEFTPLLDPLSQRDFVTGSAIEPEVEARGTKRTPEKDDPVSTQLRPTRTPRARATVRYTVTSAEQLQSEL